MKRIFPAFHLPLPIGIFLAGIFLAAGCAHSPLKEETLPLIGEFKVHKYSFPNGLKLLVVEDHSSPTFAYQTWFRVGSRDEVPGFTGLAHLFEHMMFKETKNYKDGEFDKILETAGEEGENAFTETDNTTYVQELPKGNLELIAKLESDRMVNLVVDEHQFKTELEVVQNERRMRTENSPDGTMYQELHGLAFTKHPYHWPVIGYQEDLNRMSPSDAEKFYREHYSPNHATIVVVGDVDTGEVASTVQKYYAALPARESSPHEIPAEPPQKASRHKKMKLNIQVEKLMIGFHVPQITSDDSAALEILDNILTGGKSSRLNRALVDTGIATSVGAFNPDTIDPGLFVIDANLQKHKKASLAEAVIQREIEKLIREQVPAQELERAKNIDDFGFYEGLDSDSQKARFLGEYETITHSFETGLGRHQKIQNVTALEVQAVAKKYLQPSNRSVITGVPK